MGSVRVSSSIKPECYIHRCRSVSDRSLEIVKSRNDKICRTCAHVDKMRNSYKRWVQKFQNKRCRCKLEDSIEMEL